MRNLYVFFFSTKIAKECIKARVLGPCPSLEWKDRCLTIKTLHHVCILQSMAGLEPKSETFNVFLHTRFPPQSSHFLKSVSKLTMARFWKSIRGGKQTKNLWSQSVFLSISPVLSLNLFLRCTKADKNHFSLLTINYSLFFIYFFPKSEIF